MPKKAIKLLVRPVTGSMTAIIVISAYLMLLMSGVVLILFAAFAAKDLMQTDTDRLAMAAALKINPNDRVGRMNNLIIGSRELVFQSRLSLRQANRMRPDLSGLAGRLLERARDGASLVSKQQAALAHCIHQEISQLLSDEDKKDASKVSQQFATEIEHPKTQDIELGSYEMFSNVSATCGDQELCSLDRSNGLVDVKTNLYFSDTGLPLPTEDNDLKFVLSSLPSPLKFGSGPVSSHPARSTSPKSFRVVVQLKENGIDVNRDSATIAPVVRIHRQARLAAKLIRDTEQSLSCDSLAMTNGAGEER